MSDWEEEEEPQVLPLSAYFPGKHICLHFVRFSQVHVFDCKGVINIVSRL